MRELKFKQHLASNSIPPFQSFPFSSFPPILWNRTTGLQFKLDSIQSGGSDISNLIFTNLWKQNISTRWIRWRNWPQRMELWFSAKAHAVCAMLSIFYSRELVWCLMFMRLMRTLKGGKWRGLSWGWGVTHHLCQLCSLVARWWGPPTKLCPYT